MISPTSLPEVATGQGGRIGHTNTVHTAVNELTAAVGGMGVESAGASPSIAALQEAADDAYSNGGRLVASGSLTTSTTLMIKSDADLSGLTINYTGAGTAVQVGDPASTLVRKSVTLPRMVAANKSGTGWGSVAGTVGVLVSNAYACAVTIPYVSGFETGVKVQGVPIGAAIQGTQQCSFYPLHLDNNKVNWLVAPFVGTVQADSGWANQNSVFGGRMSHNSNEGTQVAGVRHVQVDACPNVVNGWSFFGTSLESPNVVEYHVDTQGQYCQFVGCRWENTGGDASRRVRSSGVAKANTIRGGFNAGEITQVISGGSARPFDVDTDVQMHRRGGTATMPAVLLENPASSTAPVLTIMEAGAALSGANPTSEYAVRATAQQWAGKRSGDAAARLIMDTLNGRVYVGDGTAAPVAYLTGQGAAMWVGGGAILAPLTTATQDLGSATFQWRDLRLSRGIGVHGTTPPTSKPSVTGSRGGNAALASLLTALASYGLITDSTTA